MGKQTIDMTVQPCTREKEGNFRCTYTDTKPKE